MAGERDVPRFLDSTIRSVPDPRRPVLAGVVGARGEHGWALPCRDEGEPDVKNRGPWNVLRRRWATVVVGTLVGLSLGAVYTWTATVTYRAEASVFFSLTAGNSAADLVQGSTYAQNQV